MQRKRDPSCPLAELICIFLRIRRKAPSHLPGVPAKLVSRAFDDALAAAGGSLPTWLVLVSLKAQCHDMQRQLAEAVGIEGPTLTHHLNRMEAAGLVTRSRDPQNRRIQRVGLTAEGEAMFDRLRQAVVAFDLRLRTGVTSEEVAVLADLLARLRANVGASTATKVPS
jgi:MarR family transcriptional regulator, transcriptional regulator for hemolysin